MTTAIKTKSFECFFQSNIAFLKAARSVTQEALADELNVTRQVVSSWLDVRGIVPKHQALKALSVYFGVSIDDLLYKDLRKDLSEKDNPVTKGMQSNDEDKFLNDLLARLIKTQEELIEIVKLKLYNNYDASN